MQQGLRLFEAFEKPQQWRRIARFVITRNAEEVELHWRIHSLFAEDSELLASCITPPDSTHAARSSPSDNKSPTPSPSASAGKSHHHHDDAASAATSTTTTTTTTAATAALNANSSLSSSLQYHDSLTQTPALELSSSVDLDVHIYTAFDVAIVYNSPHGQHYRERVGALHVAGPVSGTGRPLGHRFPPWSTEELTMLRAALAKYVSVSRARTGSPQMPAHSCERRRQTRLGARRGRERLLVSASRGGRGADQVSTRLGARVLFGTPRAQRARCRSLSLEQLAELM